ncbi:hypothetical protein DSM3645_02703 [Blastopirellula marina DSM 3645]|uniref:Uncharacterized protein n=1 Tax=Blastopirellula marina DSM 3645 TaxID=314230 RepID=A3ZVK4_9BACT|nr:hypothetical protein DSM3645_02703 [Blastopirellula marina DSM 3645]
MERRLPVMERRAVRSRTPGHFTMHKRVQKTNSLSDF